MSRSVLKDVFSLEGSGRFAEPQLSSGMASMPHCLELTTHLEIVASRAAVLLKEVLFSVVSSMIAGAGADAVVAVLGERSATRREQRLRAGIVAIAVIL